jgi:glucose-6-phosphate 1-dehydrogenase
MEPPVTLAPGEIKIQKICLLKSARIEEIHRYQYDGYKSERGVRPDSTTETFAELKLSINNFRWSGLPIYIRTGKAVHRHGTEIGIRFKALPKLLFNFNGEIPPNQILIKIQPAEGIVVDLATKIPGTDEQITSTYMNFCYKGSFRTESPEAYQRLLFDALKGDHTLFVSAAETEVSWSLFEGLLDQGEVYIYSRGQLPQSNPDIKWIDFDKYVSFCT